MKISWILLSTILYLASVTSAEGIVSSVGGVSNQSDGWSVEEEESSEGQLREARSSQINSFDPISPAIEESFFSETQRSNQENQFQRSNQFSDNLQSFSDRDVGSDSKPAFTFQVLTERPPAKLPIMTFPEERLTQLFTERSRLAATTESPQNLFSPTRQPVTVGQTRFPVTDPNRGLPSGQQTRLPGNDEARLESSSGGDSDVEDEGFGQRKRPRFQIRRRRPTTTETAEPQGNQNTGTSELPTPQPLIGASTPRPLGASTTQRPLVASTTSRTHVGSSPTPLLTLIPSPTPQPSISQGLGIFERLKLQIEQRLSERDNSLKVAASLPSSSLPENSLFNQIKNQINQGHRDNSRKESDGQKSNLPPGLSEKERRQQVKEAEEKRRTELLLQRRIAEERERQEMEEELRRKEVETRERQALQEERRKAQEEEVARRRAEEEEKARIKEEEEETKLKMAAEAKRRQEEEEKRRKALAEEEERRRNKEEEEERRKAVEAEKKRKLEIEEEQRKKAEAEERRKQEEERRRQIVLEQERKKAAELEERRKYEVERQRQEEFTRRQELLARRQQEELQESVRSEGELQDSEVLAKAEMIVNQRTRSRTDKESPAVWAAVKALTDFSERSPVRGSTPRNILMAIIQLTDFLESGANTLDTQEEEGESIRHIQDFMQKTEQTTGVPTTPPSSAFGLRLASQGQEELVTLAPAPQESTLSSLQEIQEIQRLTDVSRLAELPTPLPFRSIESSPSPTTPTRSRDTSPPPEPEEDFDGFPLLAQFTRELERKQNIQAQPSQPLAADETAGFPTREQLPLAVAAAARFPTREQLLGRASITFEDQTPTPPSDGSLQIRLRSDSGQVDPRRPRPPPQPAARPPSQSTAPAGPPTINSHQRQQPGSSFNFETLPV